MRHANRRIECDRTKPAFGNLMIMGVLGAANLYAFVLLPAVWLRDGAAWSLSIVVPVLVAATQWATLHEAFHGHLHRNRCVNDGLGRALAILHGGAFDLLRLGHFTHHRLNGQAGDRPELYDPVRVSWHRAALRHYVRLFGGVHIAAIAGNFLLLSPRWLRARVTAMAWWLGAEDGDAAAAVARSIADGQLALRSRLDAAAALGWLALSATLYGSNWPLLAAAIAGRALIQSLLDNAYHYGAPLGDRTSGHNLRLSPLLAASILNFNLHRLHHRRPDLCWQRLPDVFAATGERYDGRFASAVARQLRGPIPIPRLAA